MFHGAEIVLGRRPEGEKDLRVVIVSGREPEGRKDPITDSDVIISAARSLREGKRGPGDGAVLTEDIPAFKSDCSFCPGNEEETPNELVSFRTNPYDQASWISRGFPNKWPILALEARGEHDWKNLAFGVNEIVVETPRHNGFLTSLSPEEISGALEVIVNRYFSLRRDAKLEWFSVFKNCGRTAGASIEHPHIQIAAKACIPKKYRGRYLLAQEYFWNEGNCLCCDQIKRHRKIDEDKKINQIVLETKHFVLLVPYEARMPYHMRIFPTAHKPSFAHMLRDNEEVRYDFADVLKKMIFLFKVAVQGEDFGRYSDPTYNLYIETSPFKDDHKESFFHWHVEFHGKTTIEAGYEQHTGEFVNPTYPEEIAEQLREIASVHLK